MQESFWNLYLSWINDYIVIGTRTCGQSVGGRNQKRCANHNKDICLESSVHGYLHVWDRLSKPYNIRTKLTPVFGFVAKVNIIRQRTELYAVCLLFVDG